jgi:hypothetical protein
MRMTTGTRRGKMVVRAVGARGETATTMRRARRGRQRASEGAAAGPHHRGEEEEEEEEGPGEAPALITADYGAGAAPPQPQVLMRTMVTMSRRATAAATRGFELLCGAPTRAWGVAPPPLRGLLPPVEV